MDENDNEAEVVTRDIIALFSSGKSWGVSFYNETTNSIAVDEVTLSADEMPDFLFSLKVHCNPTLFLITPKLATDAALIDIISASVYDGASPIPFKIYKSSYWNQTTALEILTNRCIVKCLNTDFKRQKVRTAHENYTAISGLIDTDNMHSMSSLGALLSYLQSDILNLEHGTMYLNSLSILSMSSHMCLTLNTMKALQIFQEDYHPNVIKGLTETMTLIMIYLDLSQASFYFALWCNDSVLSQLT